MPPSCNLKIGARGPMFSFCADSPKLCSQSAHEYMVHTSQLSLSAGTFPIFTLKSPQIRKQLCPRQARTTGHPTSGPQAAILQSRCHIVQLTTCKQKSPLRTQSSRVNPICDPHKLTFLNTTPTSLLTPVQGFIKSHVKILGTYFEGQLWE